MPMSCKCILDRMVHKGAMTEKERDKILRNIKYDDADFEQQYDNLQKAYEHMRDTALEYRKKLTEERKTGKWKYNTEHGYYGCTNCDHRLGFGAVLDLGGLPCACPWCGAKMEGDNES